MRVARDAGAVLVGAVDEALVHGGVAEVDGVVLHVEDDRVDDALHEDEALNWMGGMEGGWMCVISKDRVSG